MHSRVVPHFLCLALLVASAVAPLLPGAVHPQQINKPYNEFVLPRIDTREQVALSQFRGKKVLLIHFASW